MSKVTLDPILTGYNVSKINENFQTIQEELNDNILYRKNPVGEPNQMENSLDMNGYQILNVAKPSQPTDVVRLVDLEGYDFGDGSGTIDSGFIDIRNYGAIPNDPSIDNSEAILAAILDAASTQSPVVMYGGVYHCNTFTVDTQCSLVGGILAPTTGANEAAPLIRIRADGCRLDKIVFDSNGTSVHALQINSNDNVITDIIARNLVGNSLTPGGASAVHIIGDRNTVNGVYVYDYVTGTSTNPSLPRCISFSSGCTSNSVSNVEGFNVAAGVVHSDGTHNTIKNFKFDNSVAGSSEMRNGLYCIEGTVGFTAQQGVIEGCSQPIVDVGLNSTYKDITEIDSFSDGIQYPCKNVTFDGIIKYWNDKSQDNGGFLRTRSGNSGQAVDGVVIQNCDIDLATFYASFLTFDTGAVNNLLVKNNTVRTRHTVDGETARDIVIHEEGDNIKYANNTFTVINDATPFTADEFFYVRLPRQKTKGFWKNNELYSDEPNIRVRVLGALDTESFYVEDSNQVRADIGQGLIQSGVSAKFLSGVAPPNAGAWRAGDTLLNTVVNLSPNPGFEYQKHLFFVCIKSGDFADANSANHPEFKNYVDLTSGTVIGNISTPSITSPLGGQEFNSTSVSITASAFSATAGITHASTNWQVATDIGFTSIVFESLADSVNLSSITATSLPNPSQLYVRVQYIGNGGEVSSFSTPLNFSTSFTPSVDESVGEVSTFSAVSGFHSTNVQALWTSANKALVFSGFDAGQVSRSFDKVNFSSVSTPLNTIYAVRSVDGADDGSRVFVSGSTKNSTDTGVYYSTNPTAGTPTWTMMSGLTDTGPVALDVFSACDSTGSNVLVAFGASTVDASNVTNSIWKSTNGSSLTRANGIQSSHGGVECVHVAKNAPNYFFIATAGSATNPGRISSSSNSSTSWTHVVPPGLSVGQKIFDIESTADGQTVYASCSGGKMYKSINAGVTWTQILSGVTTESVRSVAVSYDGQLVTFGLQNGGYIRSFDGGNNFSLTTALSDKILAMTVNSAGDLMYIGGVGGDIEKSEL